MCLCVLTVVSSLSFPVYLSPFSLSLSLWVSPMGGLSARLLKEPSLAVLAALFQSLSRLSALGLRLLLLLRFLKGRLTCVCS